MRPDPLRKRSAISPYSRNPLQVTNMSESGFACDDAALTALPYGEHTPPSASAAECIRSETYVAIIDAAAAASASAATVALESEVVREVMLI